MQHVVTSSDKAYRILRSIAFKEVEEFWAMALRADKSLIRTELLFRGTADCCLIHPRDVFRFALRHNASSLLVAHNHPSQNPMPSDMDVQLTHQLVQAGRLMQIPILDHIIVAARSYVSFADEGWI